jgi:hypothetical protein
VIGELIGSTNGNVRNDWSVIGPINCQDVVARKEYCASAKQDNAKSPLSLHVAASTDVLRVTPTELLVCSKRRT